MNAVAILRKLNACADEGEAIPWTVVRQALGGES